MLGEPDADGVLAVRARDWREHRPLCGRPAHGTRDLDGVELRGGQSRLRELARRCLRAEQPRGEKLGAPHDRRCRVVELVREACGQLAERHQLLVAQVARRELARAIHHRVHERGGYRGTLAAHLAECVALHGEHHRRLLGHHVVRRRRDARVGHHAAHVARAPLQDLVPALRPLGADHEMPFQHDHHDLGLLTLRGDDGPFVVRAHDPVRREPRVLARGCTGERAVEREARHHVLHGHRRVGEHQTVRR